MNKLLNVGIYKGKIVWVSKNTYAYGDGPMYIQKGNKLQALTEKQKASIIERKW